MSSNAKTCEYGNEESRVHRSQECIEPAMRSVRWILGVNSYCLRHAWLVVANETEWDQGEANALEQGLPQL